MPYLKWIFILLLFSCSRKNDMAGCLTGGSVKHWDLYDTAQGRTGWSYSFSADGKCTYWYYTGRTCSRTEMYDDDLVFENTWLLKGDSMLRYRSFERKVIVLNEDTLLTAFRGKETLLLKSSCP